MAERRRRIVPRSKVLRVKRARRAQERAIMKWFGLGPGEAVPSTHRRCGGRAPW